MSDRSIVWGTKMNKSGLMGVVDKTWILLNRVTILAYIAIIIIIIILLVLVYIRRLYKSLSVEHYTEGRKFHNTGLSNTNMTKMSRYRITPYPQNQHIL